MMAAFRIANIAKIANIANILGATRRMG